MPLIPSILNFLNSQRIRQIDRFKNHPAKVQEKTFHDLLSKASGTEWGQKYGFSTISTIREFQSRLPVQTYEEIIPYVERLRKGESGLLWPGEIKWFAKSSGTTSTKSKFISMSREA